MMFYCTMCPMLDKCASKHKIREVIARIFEGTKIDTECNDVIASEVYWPAGNWMEYINPDSRRVTPKEVYNLLKIRIERMPDEACNKEESKKNLAEILGVAYE